MPPTKERANGRSRAFQTSVTGAGLGLWLVSLVTICVYYPLRSQLMLLSLVPVIIFVSLFLNTLQLPSGLKFKHERMSLTLSDAIVLLVAYWYGLAACAFLAGFDGFAASRRTTRTLSSNLFSSSIMSLAAAAAACSLDLVLHYELGRIGSTQDHAFPYVAVALMVASIAQAFVNMGLISMLLALRHGNPIVRTCRENLLWCIPMFLANGAAASSMQLALRSDRLAMVIIGGPLLGAIYFWHRHYRVSVQEQVLIREKAHRETIEALAVAINAKDQVTHDHVRRVQIYAAGVARILGCTGEEVEALRAGALLHDIGKIAVPDYILNKPGKLTAAEFEKMKIHTLVGAQILGRVEFPYPIVPVVRHHHERWDGKGYPDGLRGEEIPLTARILSVVDCFDAVREDRQYRRGLTREEAINLVLQGSGTQYDPRVVGTFLTHLPEFEAEIQAQRNEPAATFGIEPMEELSEVARQVTPAAGLAEESAPVQVEEVGLSAGEAQLIAEVECEMESARDASHVTRVFVRGLAALVPNEMCALTLAMPDDEENIVVHATGRDAGLLASRRITTGEGVTGWVLANRRAYLNSDPKLDVPLEITERFAAYRTMSVFPIVKDKEVYGTVALYSSSPNAHTEEHQRLLSAATTSFASVLATLPEHEIMALRSHTVADETPQFTRDNTKPSLNMTDTIEVELTQ